MEIFVYCRYLASGSTVFKKGEPGYKLYVLLEGCVGLHVESGRMISEIRQGEQSKVGKVSKDDL